MTEVKGKAGSAALLDQIAQFLCQHWGRMEAKDARVYHVPFEYGHREAPTQNVSVVVYTADDDDSKHPRLKTLLTQLRRVAPDLEGRVFFFEWSDSRQQLVCVLPSDLLAQIADGMDHDALRERIKAHEVRVHDYTVRTDSYQMSRLHARSIGSAALKRIASFADKHGLPECLSDADTLYRSWYNNSRTDSRQVDFLMCETSSGGGGGGGVEEASPIAGLLVAVRDQARASLTIHHWYCAQPSDAQIALFERVLSTIISDYGVTSVEWGPNPGIGSKAYAAFTTTYWQRATIAPATASPGGSAPSRPASVAPRA